MSHFVADFPNSHKILTHAVGKKLIKRLINRKNQAIVERKVW
jgi:hypothetical protein